MFFVMIEKSSSRGASRPILGDPLGRLGRRVAPRDREFFSKFSEQKPGLPRLRLTFDGFLRIFSMPSPQKPPNFEQKARIASAEAEFLKNQETRAQPRQSRLFSEF